MKKKNQVKKTIKFHIMVSKKQIMAYLSINNAKKITNLNTIPLSAAFDKIKRNYHKLDED